MSAKVFKHYGVDVIYQSLDYGQSYREILESHGVDYTELPLLDHTVFKYKNGEETRYALDVRTGEYGEVYITSEIPADLNWEKLRTDCREQSKGAPPMPFKTRAALLCETAINMCNDDFFGTVSNDDWFAADFVLTPSAFRTALAHLGFDFDDILKMDHHDVADDFLKEMN